MMEVVLFILNLACTLVIAFNLFVVEISDAFTLEAMVALVDLIVILGEMFVFSYLSEWITTDLLDIGDIFYNSPWYRLPIKQQKLLVLPIQRTGRELRLTGLGLFDCSLMRFSAVCSMHNTHSAICRLDIFY